LKGFEQVARKYGVDYAITKDQNVIPPKYTVFFKAKDADALTSAFEEWMLMMLYSPGTRTGLIAELQTMQKSLTGRDRNLRRWTASLLAKLAEMTDAEYEALDLYPDE